jgi:hypothetical protein
LSLRSYLESYIIANGYVATYLHVRSHFSKTPDEIRVAAMILIATAGPRSEKSGQSLSFMEYHLREPEDRVRPCSGAYMRLWLKDKQDTLQIVFDVPLRLHGRDGETGRGRCKRRERLGLDSRLGLF